MKKLILTHIMIAIAIFTAAAKSPVKTPNAELQGNWRYEINYVVDSVSCYLKSENYYFYGNNECMVYHNLTNCLTQETTRNIAMLTWKVVNNLILFYDSNNKIVSHIMVKDNPNIVLSGDNESTIIKNINNAQAEELFSQVLPN